MTKMTPYYVYNHIDPESKEILYIGIGQYDRAWCVRGNNRNKNHVNYLKEMFLKGYTLTTKEMCEFAKALKEMGYGYQRISYLLGSSAPKNNAMSIKRMLNYV